MDYTLSPDYATHAGTGNRMHEENAAVTTVWSEKDANSVIWGLMEVLKAGGQIGAQFDEAVPATYKVLVKALKAMTGGNVTTINAANSPYALTADNAGLVIMDAAAGNIVANLPAVNAVTAAKLNFDFVRVDASAAYTAAVNRAGADTFVGGATSFTLAGLNDFRSIAGNAGASWATTASSSGGKVQGAFKNLQASATGTNANVSVTVDEISVENPSNDYQTLRNVNVAINSAANGANGLDIGALAASTWYSVWAIWNGTAAAGLLSLSSTAPTMPIGYTHKARVGWIRTDGTGNKYPLAFKQYGRKVQYSVGAGNVISMPVIISGTQGNPVTPTWVPSSVSGVVPPTASSINAMIIAVNANNTQTAIAPNNNYGSVGSASSPPIQVGVTGVSVGLQVAMVFSMLLESTNIFYASSAGASGAALCMGWEDNF